MPVESLSLDGVCPEVPQANKELYTSFENSLKKLVDPEQKMSVDDELLLSGLFTTLRVSSEDPDINEVNHEDMVEIQNWHCKVFTGRLDIDNSVVYSRFLVSKFILAGVRQINEDKGVEYYNGNKTPHLEKDQSMKDAREQLAEIPLEFLNMNILLPVFEHYLNQDNARRYEHIEQHTHQLPQRKQLELEELRT